MPEKNPPEINYSKTEAIILSEDVLNWDYHIQEPARPHGKINVKLQNPKRDIPSQPLLEGIPLSDNISEFLN